MKTIAAIATLFVGIATQCLAAGDPVSSVTKTDREETTTFQRDGKTILKITLYRPTEPELRILYQAVMVNDEVVLVVEELCGTRTLVVREKASVSVSIEQDSSTGELKRVLLTDGSNMVVEVFGVKDGRLTPVSGKKLDITRNYTKDLNEIFARLKAKKTTLEEFLKELGEFRKKYKPERSDK